MTSLSEEELLKEHEKMIRFHSRKFKKTPVTDKEDYEQSGAFALINSSRKFDNTRKTKFSTYAYPSIFREILKSFNKFSKNKTVTSKDHSYSEADRIWEYFPDNLTPLEKVCLELIVLKYKLKDISEHVDLPVKEVKKAIESAKEKVRSANKDL